LTMCAGVAILALCTGASLAQDKTKTTPAQPSKPAQPAKPGDMKPADKGGDMKGMPSAEDMKRMEDAAKPGPPHAMLAKPAGDWTTVSKWRMAPEAPWMESTGTAKRTMILDGRYLHEEVSGSMEMPGPDGKMQKHDFHGAGVFGYNNISKQYEGS